MITVRLPKEMEKKIEALSQKKLTTKSEIIKEALQEYLEKQENLEKPFDLGKELFGKYGSGKGNLSIEYKKKVREKVHAKMSH